MIPALIIIGMAFIWLGYETDWLRIRLLVGKQRRLILHSFSPLLEQQGRWQFRKYGDDCVMMRDRCYVEYCNLCRKGERFFAWRIPGRTVKVARSTINFKAGCNLYRAKLLKDIVKIQKQKTTVSLKGAQRYTHSNEPVYWGGLYEPTYEPSIELLVDGKSVADINGDYKRGMIKEALKPYTSKGRIGRKAFTMPIGEADRVVAP